ncbi:MAG TPA: archaemetzincin [Pirellulales bacterium]|nr:archaemetzincin [Pirellulales bacterium]
MAPAQAQQARDAVLESDEALTLEAIDRVNRLITEHNADVRQRRGPPIEPLIPEATRKFAVFVYRQQDQQWVRDEGRSFVTNEKAAALDYVAQVKRVAGWTATTNARERFVLDAQVLPPTLGRLMPLHRPLGDPLPEEWLARHDEPPQDYAQYVASRPVRATRERQTLDVQPLGEFTATERRIIDTTVEYLGIYFQLPVRLRQDFAESVIPAEATRRRDDVSATQISTIYVRNQVLKPRLPDDAVGYVALTGDDLFTGSHEGTVLGEASLAERVGVWSIHRFGNPEASSEAYHRALRWALHVAAHETGHLFSLPHCTYFDCSMRGSRRFDEFNRIPMWLCPNCLAKLCYATGAKPEKRFRELIVFGERYRLEREAKFWRESLEAMGTGP